MRACLQVILDSRAVNQCEDTGYSIGVLWRKGRQQQTCQLMCMHYAVIGILYNNTKAGLIFTTIRNGMYISQDLFPQLKQFGFPMGKFSSEGKKLLKNVFLN